MIYRRMCNASAMHLHREYEHTQHLYNIIPVENLDHEDKRVQIILLRLLSILPSPILPSLAS